MAKLPTEFSIDYLAKVYRSIFTFHCLIIDNAIIFDNKKGELPRRRVTEAKRKQPWWVSCKRFKWWLPWKISEKSRKEWTGQQRKQSSPAYAEKIKERFS